MQTNYFGPSVQNNSDGADPTINIHDLVYPEVETDLEEGDEYLDDKIRVADHPDDDGKSQD